MFCKVSLESRIRAEVRKRSEKKVTGRTTPEVLIISKNCSQHSVIKLQTLSEKL